MKVSNLDKDTESPMQLDELKIDIKVIGQIAITTMDMTYYNNNSRIMEGEFNFPLAEGQSVSRFALDINGKLREGVVVEKEQGRKTFEAIVRRGVDPGLLEMTEGNNFRSRVYPLPAKGARRVVIAFEQELTNKGNNDLYILPLKINEPVSKFIIHAEVIKNQVNLDTKNELANLAFKQWNDSYIADFEQVNYTPDKQVALSFPQITDSAKVFSAFKNKNKDTSYFFLNLRPIISVETKILPKTITLLWDNSNSAQNRDLDKEICILDAYIQKKENLHIDLVAFSINVEKPISYDIANGNWDNLRSALKSMIYDGATSFGCIDFSKYKSDEVLLFSDGMTNYGNIVPKFASTPVYTINSNAIANHSFLTYIAQQSGGVYVNISKYNISEALSLLCTNNFHFISAQVKSGKTTDIYPSMACQFNNSLGLAGIIQGKSATLELNFGFGNKITYSKSIEINADSNIEPDLLRRIWAEKKIAELSLNTEKNKETITLLGKEYGIVTQNTSLIVFENLSDYMLYDIIPPKELQADYFRLKSLKADSANESTKKHIDSVVALSDGQSKWWNTNYPIAPKVSGKLYKTNNRNARFRAPVVVDTLREEVIVNEAPAEAMEMRLAEADESEEPAFMVVEERADAATSTGYAMKKSEDKRSADIQLNAWDPQTPYLKVLQYSSEGQEYNTYLKLKKEYGATPAFYIDACDFFSKLGKKDTAVKIISNLAELKLEAPQLLRILGEKLMLLSHNEEAINVFEKVLKLKGEEPQSYRDLGLAYEASGNTQKAINTLYEVIKRQWDSRFPAIELIVLNEINNLIIQHTKVDYSFIDKRLIKKEPVDIRVVLSWDTDNCDMDLWVTDPSGEKCFYQNKLTRLGGKISNDFTRGYGPEEYMIKKAINGDYLVQANYYGTSSQSILAPVNLHLTFISNFGKPNQKMQEVTLRLESQKDIIDVGKFSFKNN
jgi:tetratricopeptide (TPR) repeat protein